MILLAIGAFFFVLSSAIASLFAPFMALIQFDPITLLQQGLTYVYALMIVFWPLRPIAICMTAYIPLKLMLMVARFILGARVPDAS